MYKFQRKLNAKLITGLLRILGRDIFTKFSGTLSSQKLYAYVKEESRIFSLAR